MNPEAAIDVDRRRIEALIAALDALDDPRAREPARELVHAVLELHGAGLARLIEIVAVAGAAGGTIVESMARDPAVSGLLLHGLHPQGLKARVRQAVDRLRAVLGARGIRIERVPVAQNEAALTLAGGSNGKAIRMAGLRQEIESAIYALAPDLAALRIDGLAESGEHVAEVAFVPLASIGQRTTAAAP